eukprot:528926_1
MYNIYKCKTWFITTNTITNNTNIQWYNITENSPTVTVTTPSYTPTSINPSINPSDMPTETAVTSTPTHIPFISPTYTPIYLCMGLVLEFENVNDRDYNSFIGRYEIKNVNDLLSDNHWWQLLQYDGSHIFYSDDIIFHYQSCKIILVII